MVVSQIYALPGGDVRGTRETNNSKRRKDKRLQERGLQRLALAEVVAAKRGIPKKQALAEVTPPGLLKRLAALQGRYR